MKVQNFLMFRDVEYVDFTPDCTTFGLNGGVPIEAVASGAQFVQTDGNPNLFFEFRNPFPSSIEDEHSKALSRWINRKSTVRLIRFFKAHPENSFLRSCVDFVIYAETMLFFGKKYPTNDADTRKDYQRIWMLRRTLSRVYRCKVSGDVNQLIDWMFVLGVIARGLMPSNFAASQLESLGKSRLRNLDKGNETKKRDAARRKLETIEEVRNRLKTGADLTKIIGALARDPQEKWGSESTIRRNLADEDFSADATRIV